jgi:hypothetical protein
MHAKLTGRALLNSGKIGPEKEDPPGYKGCESIDTSPKILPRIIARREFYQCCFFISLFVFLQFLPNAMGSPGQLPPDAPNGHTATKQIRRRLTTPYRFC